MAEISMNSISDLENLASRLVDEIKPGSVILLNGEMGAGKTSFVQAFAKSLGVSDPVRSPTFIIHNEYKLENDQRLHHIDLYRLDDVSELNELRIRDSLSEKSYIFIEWADKFEKELLDLFPNTKIYKLDFKVINENSRLVNFTKL